MMSSQCSCQPCACMMTACMWGAETDHSVAPAASVHGLKRFEHQIVLLGLGRQLVSAAREGGELVAEILVPAQYGLLCLQLPCTASLCHCIKLCVEETTKQLISCAAVWNFTLDYKVGCALLRVRACPSENVYVDGPRRVWGCDDDRQGCA